MVVKIPGVAYTVRLAQSEGTHKVEILLRSDVVVAINLTSHTPKGIQRALTEAIKQAEISHQVPSGILANLAEKLSGSSGYLDDSGDGPPGIPDSVKLDNIIILLEQLDERIERIEKIISK